MASLDELLALVRENNTMIDGLNTLLDGLRQQVLDILSGAAIPAPIQAKVDAVFAEAIDQRAKLTEVITENTPQAGP